MNSDALVELVKKHLPQIREGNSDTFEEEAKREKVKLDAEKISAFQEAIKHEPVEVRGEINRALCEAHVADKIYARDREAAYRELKAQYRQAGYDRLI